jgi:hypothetical protein
LPDSNSDDGSTDLLAKFTDIVNVADKVYDNDIATTKHPGNNLFVIALCISLCGIVGLPLNVKLGQCLLVTDDIS